MTTDQDTEGCGEYAYALPFEPSDNLAPLERRLTGLFRCLIQFQPAFYPIAEWLRTVPLRGINFGVAEAHELEPLKQEPRGSRSRR